jgi:hypothetical protein
MIRRADKKLLRSVVRGIMTFEREAKSKGKIGVESSKTITQTSVWSYECLQRQTDKTDKQTDSEFIMMRPLQQCIA